jgi:hypothetical protein
LEDELAIAEAKAWLTTYEGVPTSSYGRSDFDYKATMLAAYAISECSRLASRVEELEKGLREIRRELIHVGKKTQYTSSETGMTDQVRLKKIRAFAHRGSKLAEKLLAGAHAEEKE